MAARTTTSTRWVLGILVVALLACVLVVVGLIQITGASPSSSSSSQSPTADSASAAASSSGAPPSSSRPSTSGARSSATTPTAPPVELAGSGLSLPAAWTGTADMTITVHGRCAATGGTSLYSRPAQFALQVAPPLPARTGPTTPSGAPGSAAAPGASGSTGPGPGVGSSSAPAPVGTVSMTLGIASTEVPGLSIYSTSTGRDGAAVRETWDVQAQADPLAPDRTLISATLVDDQPAGGVLPPNLLVDSETDLQPCEAESGVRLPRPLAKGSTVTGWVSPTQASLQVNATTTDGERSVQAVLDLARAPGS